MKRNWGPDRCFPCSLAFGLYLAMTVLPASAQLQPLRIGIVHDGPWERNEEVRSAFQQEIRTLLDREYDVQFPQPKIADYTAAGIRAAFDELLADPEFDLVLALGPLVSNHAGHRENLPKPVLAPFVLRAFLQGIPMTDDGTSGRENLTYVQMGADTVEEIRRFREITPFRHLVMLISAALAEELPTSHLPQLLREAGVEMEVTRVPVRESADEALAAIPEQADAVYITPLQQLGEGEFRSLIGGLVERRLPSFSFWGREEVQMGVLAGLGLNLDLTRLARRTALNLQRILLGEPASDLSVLFDRRQRLTFNMQTARAIGVFPSWAVMTEAEVLSEERPSIERTVSLPSAVEAAVRANLDLRVAERSVAAGSRRVDRQRAEFGPQVSTSGSGSLIDKDRAEAGFGSAGRFQLQGGVGVRQLVYSEPARAAYEVEAHLQRTREEERNQLRLDVIREAAVGYLQVLRAKTVERIVRSNLELTRRHLETARNRLALGAAGPGEVYRFENQIAVNRRDVIDANTARNQAEIAINRLMSRPLEEPFETRDAAIDDPEFVLSFRRLEPYVGSIDAFKVFRSFMVEEAFQASPELRRLQAAIDAQERALLAARRSYYVPDVAAQAEVFGRGRYGAGSDPSSLPLPPGITFPVPGNVDWTVGFSASLPLFTSGARRAEISRLTEEIAGLRMELDASRERIEQRARTFLHSAGASYAGIDLADDAADAARRTLDVVSDSYSRGLVDNITLLDAQNQALLADLRSSNAVYDFLIDLMEVQRAVGRFDFFISPEQEQAFLDRMNAFYRMQGFSVREQEEFDE